MSRAPRSLRCLGLSCWIAAPLVTALAVAGSARAADRRPTRRPPRSARPAARRAAKAFMLGRYEEALATYLDLYIKSDGGRSTYATLAAASRS